MDGVAAGGGIERPVRRLEDLRLLIGKGRYSDDLNLPNQAHAVMVRSPHAHARIHSIDIRRAQRTPGTLAVLTGRDFLADGLNPIPFRTAAAIAIGSCGSASRPDLSRVFSAL